MRPERDGAQVPSSSAEVKNESSCTSDPSCLHGADRKKLSFYLLQLLRATGTRSAPQISFGVTDKNTRANCVTSGISIGTGC
jgi:hypothetical protein